MIELNKTLPQIGDRVVIPRGLSWQVDGFDGEYRVVKLEKITWERGIILEREGLKVEIGADVWGYLTGTSVPNAPEWTTIDHHKYQPELNDEYQYDYHTEDSTEFGFWYFGWCGDHRILDSSMISCPWCYGRFPWDK